MSDNKKFYHELTPYERDKLIGTITYGELMAKYKQPDWCTYPSALEGRMGCWSLMDATKITKESDCFECELHIKCGETKFQKFDKWIDEKTSNLYIFTGMYWMDKVNLEYHDTELKENSATSEEDRVIIRKLIAEYYKDL